MRRTLALLLALAAVVAAGASVPAERKDAARTADALAADAARWLWARQGEDGGWHSETYGLLRSGQALTPFVLDALLESRAGRATAPPRGAARALAFLRARVDAEGRLGVADPDLLEYPTYATAYALRCLVAAGDPADRALVARMADVLVRAQYREENGFRASDPAYGGWGFGGRQPPGVPGHMDLAHTRRVLEALRAAGRDDAAVRLRAEAFLRRVQNPPATDGGFSFSPVVLAANKGGKDGDRHRSYATATCDGLLALLAAGVPATDERVASARAWLARHGAADVVEGIPAGQPTPWASALTHYHEAVRAEVERALGSPPAWRDRVAPLLAARRRPDGSFASASALMKEDDPLLATALALIALR